MGSHSTAYTPLRTLFRRPWLAWLVLAMGGLDPVLESCGSDVCFDLTSSSDCLHRCTDQVVWLGVAERGPPCHAGPWPRVGYRWQDLQSAAVNRQSAVACQPACSSPGIECMRSSMMMPVSNFRNSSYGGRPLSLTSTMPPCRPGSSVPEFYGKPSPYSAGTQFLGTPKDHLEVRSSGRALSPGLMTCQQCPGFACMLWLHSQSSQPQDKWVMPACLACVWPAMPIAPVLIFAVAEPACHQSATPWPSG